MVVCVVSPCTNVSEDYNVSIFMDELYKVKKNRLGYIGQALGSNSSPFPARLEWPSFIKSAYVIHPRLHFAYFDPENGGSTFL
jgi:hypothetical protein